MKNCYKNNYFYLIENEIDFAETNSKICSCGAENHEYNYYIIQKTNFKLSSNEEKEIDKITDLCKDYTIIEKQKLFREKVINLIEGKENDKILEIISNMLNINEIKINFIV